METKVRAAKRYCFRLNGVRQKQLTLGVCLCSLLVMLLGKPVLVAGDQSSVTPAQPPAEQGKGPSSKPPSTPEKEPSQEQLSSPDSKPAQPKNPISKIIEGLTSKGEQKGEQKGEEGTDKEKEGAGKKTVSSLILTVKLALVADSRLFPYDIEVETKSDEVILSGKVSSEAEKSIASEIARSVPGVKSVTNKIEIVKDLPDVLANRQDDNITSQVKERFAKSTTLKAAGFEVKTERGVVSLGGTVRFQVFVLEAAEAARQVPGVKAVKTDKVKIESEG